MSEPSDPKKTPADRFVTATVIFLITLVVGAFLSGRKPPPAPDMSEEDRQRAFEAFGEQMKKANEGTRRLEQFFNLRDLEERLKKLPPVDSLERQELEERINDLRKGFPGPKRKEVEEEE